MPAVNKEKQKYLRQLGHSLKPVVTVAANGLSGSVLKELERALEDHELIKVKLNVDDRASLAKTLCSEVGADLIQSIGKIILIHRVAKQTNPKLSNLIKN